MHLVFDLFSVIYIFLKAFMYTIRDLLYVYCLTFSALFTPREATRSSNAWVRWCYKKLQRLWSSLQRIWGMLRLFGYSLNYWSPYFSCESILPQIKNIFKPRPPIISPSLQRTVLQLLWLVLSSITTNPVLALLISFLAWAGSLDSQIQRHGRQLEGTR